MINLKYTVTQNKKGKFTFISSNKLQSEVEVFLKKSPDDVERVLLFKTKKESHEFELLNLDYRPYFVVKDGDLECLIAERTLIVDGMNNFRDMGGYETYDNRKVKWGKLYRSDHIHNASEIGVNFLRKLNINTIVDYRSSDEIGKYPNKIISEDIITHQLDPDAHTAELSAQLHHLRIMKI
jgi:protein-tyrosine phosphatase